MRRGRSHPLSVSAPRALRELGDEGALAEAAAQAAPLRAVQNLPQLLHGGGQPPLTANLALALIALRGALPPCLAGRSYTRGSDRLAGRATAGLAGEPAVCALNWALATGAETGDAPAHRVATGKPVAGLTGEHGTRVFLGMPQL